MHRRRQQSRAKASDYGKAGDGTCSSGRHGARTHHAVCAASNTDWEHAGIPGETMTAMVVKGLIEGEPAGGSPSQSAVLQHCGHAAFNARAEALPKSPCS
jgi:hypothetical protein